MRQNHTLLKSFFLSFLIHIIGISLFSIIFPIPVKKRFFVETILLPKVEGKKIEQKEKIVSKKIEKKEISEKIAVFKEFPSEKISDKQIYGISTAEKIPVKELLSMAEYIPERVKRIENPEISDFEIKFPSIEFSEKISPEISEEKIEGPAGKRKIIYKEKIEYPLWAQKKGIEGKVKIKFWVDPDGKIVNTEIQFSSGEIKLDLYAEENFRKWLFEPVQTDKNVWGIITLNFKLK